MKTTLCLLMLILSGHALSGPCDKSNNALNLSEAQKAQMHAIKQQQHEKLKAAREQIMAESKTAMLAFLTAEQMAKMDQRNEHRKAHGDLNRGHRKMKKKGHKRRIEKG